MDYSRASRENTHTVQRMRMEQSEKNKAAYVLIRLPHTNAEAY
jgi:hypothetical protein